MTIEILGHTFLKESYILRSGQPKIVRNINSLPPFATVQHIDGAPAISRLFHTIRPLAIVRFIVTIVVNAVNGTSVVWPWTHISEEIRKGLSPTVTNLDATSTISVPIPIIPICASLDQAYPSFVLWHVTWICKSFTAISRHFRSPTPTGTCPTASEVSKLNRAFDPTDTNAPVVPFSVLSESGNLMKDGQPPVDSALVWYSRLEHCVALLWPTLLGLSWFTPRWAFPLSYSCFWPSYDIYDPCRLGKPRKYTTKSCPKPHSPPPFLSSYI